MNEGVILPATLIIIVLVVTVLILMVAESGSKRAYNRKRDDSSIIDRVNQAIKKYHDVTTELAAAVYTKSREIALYQDDSAIGLLKTYVATANKTDSDMSDYIARMRDCVSRRDTVGAAYVLQAIESDLYLLEDILKEVNSLRIKDMTSKARFDRSQRNYYEYRTDAPQSSASDLSVYFKGCKTKEDLTVRYRSLAKTLHPDAKGGSTIAFEEMKAEYDNLVKEYVNG